jgi:hypothetical protein
MKKTILNNFRVVITPSLWAHEQKDPLRSRVACQNIIDDVKRHVDNISSMDIEYDTEEVCSFCGYAWDVDPETGEPLCCSEAQGEWSVIQTPK